MAMQIDYFVKGPQGRADFYRDFYYPFVKRWDAEIARWEAEKGKKLKRMIEAVPNEFCPEWPEELRPTSMVYAPHWCDPPDVDGC